MRASNFGGTPTRAKQPRRKLRSLCPAISESREGGAPGVARWVTARDMPSIDHLGLAKLSNISAICCGADALARRSRKVRAVLPQKLSSGSIRSVKPGASGINAEAAPGRNRTPKNSSVASKLRVKGLVIKPTTFRPTGLLFLVEKTMSTHPSGRMRCPGAGRRLRLIQKHSM
jgi:hypothetical protein